MAQSTPYTFYVETKLPTEILSIRVAQGEFSDNPTPEEKLLHAIYRTSNPIIRSIELFPNDGKKVKIEVYFTK